MYVRCICYPILQTNIFPIIISVPNSTLSLQLLPISIWSSSVELPLRCSGSLQQMQTKDSHTLSQLRVPVWRQSGPLPHQEACQWLWAVCRSWQSTLCQCRQWTVVDSAGHWQLQSEWWPLVSWVQLKFIICSVCVYTQRVLFVVLHATLATIYVCEPFHWLIFMSLSIYVRITLLWCRMCTYVYTYHNSVFLPISPFC